MVIKFKNKLFKILFCIFALMLWCFSPVFSMEKLNSKFDHYAKVVFIGYIGSGKTTTFELLTNTLKTLGKKNHTKQISKICVGCKLSNKNVGLLFFDSSAEPKHNKVMDEFCKNANVIIAIVNAQDLVGNELKISNSQCEFEKLLSRVRKNAPNCRVIVVLTKKELIDEKYTDLPPAFVQNRISNYVQAIDMTLDKKQNKTTEFQNIDSKYELTLNEIDSEETLTHKKNLQNLIAKSLLKYGVENLPKTSEGMDGRIFTQIDDIRVRYWLFPFCTFKDEEKVEYSLKTKLTGDVEEDTRSEYHETRIGGIPGFIEDAYINYRAKKFLDSVTEQSRSEPKSLNGLMGRSSSSCIIY